MGGIDIERVSVQRPGACIEDVSLHVAPGERVAVVGSHQPSLSVLIRACAGFERVRQGRITVAGTDVGTADRVSLLRLRQSLGYVSIAGGLLSNMTLRENLELALRYHGVRAADARDQVGARIDAVGLQTDADLRACLAPAELCKCFAYLRALLFEPAVLLSEDPSAYLHPQGREIVAALHAEAAARGVTMLIADDDLDFVRPLVDRVVPLEAAVEVAS
ncbi:MAG: ATP-binding cassette domain-containing protein [Myxococcota bacterium]